MNSRLLKSIQMTRDSFDAPLLLLSTSPFGEVFN